jgi:hypothetical protein
VNNSGLKDSGAREVFPTGGVREPNEAAKGRYDLIPTSPIRRLAVHYARGAAKYADRNWEKGLPLGRYADSAKRHLDQFLSGDRAEDHLAAVLWNTCGLMWTEEQIQAERLPVELNDLPDVVIPSRARAEASVLQARTAGSAAEQIGASRVRDAVLGDPHAPADGGKVEGDEASRAEALVADAFPRLPLGNDRNELVGAVTEALQAGKTEDDILRGWVASLSSTGVDISWTQPK